VPIYLYECTACGRRREEIHGYREPAPVSRCCEVGQIRLMPRRVRARVLEPGQARREAAGELRAAELTSITPEPRAPSEVDIPAPSWSGPPRSRAERDERYRDTTEALAAWQTRSLVADGVDYTTAKRQAEAHQQTVVAQAEAQDAP
jgi:hypothetical protein